MTKEMRYHFIQEHSGQFRNGVIFRVLGVSSSAYHRWKKRPVSQRQQQRETLVAHICDLFEESEGRYGSPRIHRDLQALGVKCTSRRVAQLMKEQRLVARKPRKFVVTTDSNHAFPPAPNLLNREYQVENIAGLNQAWAGDITLETPPYKRLNERGGDGGGDIIIMVGVIPLVIQGGGKGLSIFRPRGGTTLTMLAISQLLFGVFCCATSVLMIKASTLHPAVLSSYRLLLAALLLSPLFVSNVKKYRSEYSARDLWLTLLPASMLALHFISWAQGARWTHAANASLIVNMVPVAMPFLLYFTMREVITKKEVVGTVVALAGVVWLAASDFWVSRQSLLGDITCFGSMLLFSYYLALGRINRAFPNIWLYLVPLYAIAGAICFLVALFVANPLGPHPPRDYLLSLGLAVVPTILGHSILNHAMKHLRGQIVSVFNLFQFLFAGGLAYFLFGEAPQPTFYGAGALVLTGAIIVIRAVATMPQLERELEIASTPKM